MPNEEDSQCNNQLQEAQCVKNEDKMLCRVNLLNERTGWCCVRLTGGSRGPNIWDSSVASHLRKYPLTSESQKDFLTVEGHPIKFFYEFCYF